MKCFATYNTDQSLFFLLEAALGGELYATYHKYKWHGSSERARFYAASTIMAFDHLHDRNVIYRDLKPENLLIDGAGRCKLTDMGLAKQVGVELGIRELGRIRGGGGSLATRVVVEAQFFTLGRARSLE